MSIPKGILADDITNAGRGETLIGNLLAASMLSDAIKTSFGPCGLEKMYIDIMGESIITKDGGTFLRKIDVEHPSAKVVIDGANTVDNSVGDGTKSSVILVGSLAKNAIELIKLGISPAVIITGYQRATELSLETLNEISETRNLEKGIFFDLVRTALSSKSMSSLVDDSENLSKIIVDAVCSICDLKTNYIEVDDIKIEEKLGSASDTKLVKGVIIDKTIDNSLMPRQISNAKIILINEELDAVRTKTESEIIITSPEQMSSFLEAEKTEVLRKVKKIAESGANVVFSRKGISDMAQTYFARNGIISLRRVKENDLFWLEKATGAKICQTIEKISPNEIGTANHVYEKEIGDDKMVFVEGCKKPKSVTILIRAHSKKYLDEFHRTILDGIYVLRDFIQNPKIVGGGGAFEAIVANKIRKVMTSVDGKEQLAMAKFADSLEQIPLTLATNAGMDYLSTLSALRSKISSSNNGRCEWYGIDTNQRKITETFSKKIFEPKILKEQVIKTTNDVISILLGIDDIFMKTPEMFTHTHANGPTHTHKGGSLKHEHHNERLDRLGKEQRGPHHYY
ncbi:thermosome subunit [Marine Group I thaumarchaeote]|uniref:Thermosome subunit n=2 Tax=root TaxID=1 RepID=A0A7K4MXA7_9ARCH|nr:thermosome subunit [Marine Group I thaumarchaeote]PBO83715.1 MAG: thermosome subunit [Nitrosopumilales archaeon]NWJ21035.1 thermosome subunit [Marine Group I thaumarchaeote]NWJ43039.1 thermosome subunit [Marine Group I thaumarchaeote]NWJ67802.1 thermosome subunit [Marine Group I thaumarchaeote]